MVKRKSAKKAGKKKVEKTAKKKSVKKSIKKKAPQKKKQKQSLASKAKVKQPVESKMTVRPIEADIAEAQTTKHPLSCPLCTKEGLVLVALAIILVAIQNTWTRYLAWVVLLAAFLVPLIKQLFRRNK